jgi:hypothetical protein
MLTSCDNESQSAPASIAYARYDDNRQGFLKYEVFYDSKQMPYAFVVVGWGEGLAGEPLQVVLDMTMSIDPDTGEQTVVLNDNRVVPIPDRVVVIMNGMEGRLIQMLMPIAEFRSHVLDARGRPSPSRVRVWLKGAQELGGRNDDYGAERFSGSG